MRAIFASIIFIFLIIKAIGFLPDFGDPVDTFLDDNTFIIAENIDEEDTAYLKFELEEAIDTKVYLFAYGDGNGSLEHLGGWKVLSVLNEADYQEYKEKYGNKKCPASFLTSRQTLIRVLAKDTELGQKIKNTDWEGSPYGVPLFLKGYTLEYSEGRNRKGHNMSMSLPSNNLFFLATDLF